MATRSRLALPAALSLAVHAALVALAAAAHVGFAPSSRRVAPEPPVALELVEIEVLPAPAPDESAAVPAAPAISEIAVRPPALDRAPDPRESPPRIAATAPTSSQPAPASEPAPPGKSAPGALSMRDPSRNPIRAPTRPGESSGPPGPPSWMLSAAQIALRDVPEQPAPPPPPRRAPLAPIQPRKPPRVDSELRPDGGGTYRADDTTFTARIARDGRVTFDDKRNVQARIALPSLRQLARGLEAWADDPYGFATAGAHPESIHRAPDTDPETAPLEPPPERSNRRVDLYDEPAVIVPIIGGSFDLTDAVMRALGQDPYAARKADFLDRTLDERVQISATARRQDLREATRAVSVQLLAIWRYEAWSAARRRESLFALWDECAEEGARDVVQAADQVRAEIERFIRQTLPVGSPDAYTDDEIARLNAGRTSRRVFAPYRDRRP